MFNKLNYSGRKAVRLAGMLVASSVLAGTVVAEPLEITIEGNDRMQYDTKRFAVDPGQKVKLTLKHVGEMPVEAMGHNVVILADTEANPISFGQLVQTKGGNLDNGYLPKPVRDQVIAFTEMIGGGETATVTFTAPEKPGEYPYLCTFPLHVSQMTGVMNVKGEEVAAPETREVNGTDKVSEVLPDESNFPDPSQLNFDPDAVPEMAQGFEAKIWVREPVLLNPSALAFGRKGRLYVGGGPQYRDPDKDSPKDFVWVIEDTNDDGKPDNINLFATGLNSVQGLAWRDNELWVANPPDVTVLRDTDGDLKADEYVKVYTNLGHLRHGLHGFNWAPDGRLYMSQGNSEVQDGAPKPFRELHHIDSDNPDNQPLNKVYSPQAYEPDFIDNWPSAPHGGYLRADATGEDLEIFARGNRNPWDMTFDAGFNWLGNDQDPGDAGDKLLMVFEGAHYGMGHPRGSIWTGDSNPAVVPPSYHFTRYQKNSLVGIKYYLHDHFPKNYRDVFFINDWVNRNIYVFRPKWDGAMMKDGGDLEEFADGGTHSGGELLFTPGEGDPLFRPTDMEIGPSGAMYVASWGPQYGSRWAPYIGGDADAKVHWGRVFRIRHSKRPLTERETWYTAKRDKPYDDWSAEQLIADLGGQVRVWRTDAQNELVRRGDEARPALVQAIRSGELSQMAETYAVWALGRIGPDADRFAAWARGEDGAGLNRRIQAIRVIADRGLTQVASVIADQVGDPKPRIRFAAAQALRHLGVRNHLGAIVEVLPKETDDLCFYTQWNALRALASKDRLRQIAREADSVNLQGAALLALGSDADIGDVPITPASDEEGVKPARKVVQATFGDAP